MKLPHLYGAPLTNTAGLRHSYPFMYLNCGCGSRHGGPATMPLALIHSPDICFAGSCSAVLHCGGLFAPDKAAGSAKRLDTQQMFLKKFQRILSRGYSCRTLCGSEPQQTPIWTDLQRRDGLIAHLRPLAQHQLPVVVLMPQQQVRVPC